VDVANEECLGGAGRLLTKIKEIAAKDPDHTMVMNAGEFDRASRVNHYRDNHNRGVFQEISIRAPSITRS
jgi:hypothetical protein